MDKNSPKAFNGLINNSDVRIALAPSVPEDAVLDAMPAPPDWFSSDIVRSDTTDILRATTLTEEEVQAHIALHDARDRKRDYLRALEAHNGDVEALRAHQAAE